MLGAGGDGDGNGSILTEFLVKKKGSLDQSRETELSDDIKVSVSGKLNKLQVFIDTKIGEIRKLNDQVCSVKAEVELAQKEKENLRKLLEDLI